MNPPEEIVTSWLNEKRFFTINNHKVGASEIDILAVNPVTNEKAHIEVSVSVKPGPAPLGERGITGKPLPERIKSLVEGKFIGRKNRVAEDAERMLGGKYQRWIVLGLLNKKCDPKDNVIKEFEKHGVRVVFFEDIVSELKEKVGRHSYPDAAKRYMQLFQVFSASERNK